MDLIEKLASALDLADSLEGLNEECLDAVESLYDTLFMLENADEDDDPDELLEDALSEIADALDVFKAAGAPETLIKALSELL